MWCALRSFSVLVVFGVAAISCADELDLSGFALLRGTDAGDTFPDHSVSAQVQLGIDWHLRPALSAHVHVLARDGQGDNRRSTIGIPEAYLELNLKPKNDRLRLRGGAMFLPTSRENIDALWENPFTISSSALNSWLGEELRPIGVDATFFHRGLMGGATIFRGNDTFGALPAARGWTLDDHWTLLGEWVSVDDEYFTSVSAETDHRLGWSARTGWSNERFSVQATHLDNRSDGLDHGSLFNWNTRFDIVGADATVGDWTFAAESGWGPTFLIVHTAKYVSDLRASYVLASRRLPAGRASLRVDDFDNGSSRQQAITLAWFWSPRGKVRAGVEVTRLDGDHRITAEVRYHFARQ